MTNLENSLNESLSLLRGKKYKEALEILKKIEIEDSRVFFLLGTIYSVMKNINLGEEYLIKASKLDNKNSAIFNNLANLMVIKGDIESAKKNYLTAIEIDKNVDSMSEIANIYLNENDIDNAQKYLNMALSEDSKHKKSNFRLGNLYLKLNEHKKGLKHIRQATGLIRFNETGFEII
tara:strand:- start:273 stop:803 length:531 start_codon:yes stop_codon:yes gene_type:complete